MYKHTNYVGLTHKYLCLGITKNCGYIIKNYN